MLKGCVTMRVLRGEPSSVGTQAAWDKLCQSLRNYFFVRSRGLVRAFMERTQGHEHPWRGPVSLHFPSYIELTRNSSQQRRMVKITCSSVDSTVKNLTRKPLANSHPWFFTVDPSEKEMRMITFYMKDSKVYLSHTQVNEQ